MTAGRWRWATVAAGLAFAVPGCASILGIDDIPAGADAGADGAIDASSDTPKGDSGSDASDSGTVVAPSCEAGGAGLTNCGNGSESCCTSPLVTGGTFDRTYTNTGSGPTAKADPATVSSFRLDKYEVTVGRFRQFVSAWNNGSGWTPPAGSGKHTHLNSGQGLEDSQTPGTYEPGWAISDDPSILPTNKNLGCDANATWTNTAIGQENLPINCVSWYEAAAFCIWDEAFLPSDAEWEYAAAGGSDEREYPWGSAVPGTGNAYAIYGCNHPILNGCGGPGKLAPVGTPSLGLGAWGQLNLAGNVAEWNLDRSGSLVTPCVNCSDLTTVGRRAIRGGNFSSDETTLVPTRSASGLPTIHVSTVGFRCARTP